MRITIQTGNAEKGRSFSVQLLSYVTANTMWEGGQTDTQKTRPVWMAFGGSQQEARIFWANLRKGKVAEGFHGSRNPPKFELLKSANYQCHIQKLEDGVVYYVYLPDMFIMDPGMVDPKDISFILLPSLVWLKQQKISLDGVPEYLAKVGLSVEEGTLPFLMPMSMLFLLYLDRRTRFPLPTDPKFALQIMLASIKARYANTSYRDTYGNYGNHFTEVETTAVGMYPGLAMHTTHEQYNTFLATEIQKWHALNQ